MVGSGRTSGCFAELPKQPKLPLSQWLAAADLEAEQGNDLPLCLGL